MKDGAVIRYGLPAGLLIGLSACSFSAASRDVAAAAQPRATSSEQYHELAFVQAACGGCHAVEATGLSPNPASPSFADIANRDGLTRETLVSWLIDAHNYPEEMEFDLQSRQAERIADHILALRSPVYRRQPD